jgi:hypothetical protein
MTRPDTADRRTPGASTGRRTLPGGWYEYSTLPRSRVPLLLSVFWMTYATAMMVVDVVRDALRPRRRRGNRLAAVLPAPLADRRTPRSVAAPVAYTTRSPTPVG